MYNISQEFPVLIIPNSTRQSKSLKFLEGLTVLRIKAKKYSLLYMHDAGRTVPQQILNSSPNISTCICANYLSSFIN